MMSRPMKYLFAATAAAGLLAAAAGARTLPQPAASGMQPAATHSRAPADSRATTGSGSVDMLPRPTAAFQLHGILGCTPVPGLDCGKVQKLLAE
jgi:hypothetical protein